MGLFQFGVPLKNMPGIATYTAQWPSFWADKYGQWGCAGEITNATNDLLGMAKASMKCGRMIQAPEKPVLTPPGTVVGIKTMFRAHAVLQSLEPLEVPELWQKLFADITCSINKYQMQTMGTGYVYAMAYITGVGQVEMEARFNHNTGEFNITCVKSPFPDQFVAYLMKIPHPKYESNMFIGLYVYATRDREAPKPPTPIIMPDALHLYHVTKVNAEITPPHATLLRRGQMVRITAKAKEGFTLVSFTIDGVEQLPGALKTYADINAPGITAPDSYDPNEAVVNYGPVQADVYVSAIANGVTIEEHLTAGDEVTFQMTTTDCLVEEDSWSLGLTDLPATAIRSISPTGLVSIFFPEDVYDGNPGVTYYQEVVFRGYSQTKTLRLIFTVDPVPAFGTVWTPVTKLDESIVAMHYASDGYVYIATTTKIWKTSDLATFEPVTVASAPSTSFGDIGECSLGIVASDRYSLWLKPTGSNTLTKIPATTTTNATDKTCLTASKDSPEVSLQVMNSTGRHYIARMWDLNTTTAVTAPFYLSDTTRIAQLIPTKPVQANDGSWIYVGNLSTGYGLGRYVEGVFTLQESFNASFGSTPVMWKEASGKLYLVGVDSRSPDKYFTRTSIDNGVTWTAKVISDSSYHAWIYSGAALKKEYAVFGQGAIIIRTADSMATVAIAQALDGSVNSIIMIGDRKLLAGTDGATTNLYKSEV